MDREAAVLPYVDAVWDLDEAELVLRAGELAHATSLTPGIAVDHRYRPSAAQSMGVHDEMAKIGRRVLARLGREMHEMVCGSDSDDADARRSIANALGLDRNFLAAAIAGALVSYLGVLPAVAAVLATLTVRRVLVPTMDELCRVWGEGLV